MDDRWHKITYNNPPPTGRPILISDGRGNELPRAVKQYVEHEGHRVRARHGGVFADSITGEMAYAYMGLWYAAKFCVWIFPHAWAEVDK